MMTVVAVEIEDLGELQYYPRQRFPQTSEVMRCLPTDTRRSMPETSSSTAPTLSPTTVPGLPTDIDFPGLSSEISSDIRSFCGQASLETWGTLHGQELCRLLAYEAICPMQSMSAPRKLRCATCERLSAKATSTTKWQAFVGGRAIWG